MKKLSVALTMLPFLMVGSALAQDAQEDDFLTPQERIVGRHPQINPDWTWMTEDQATQVLRGKGYDVVLSLEKSESVWRGKAMRDNESYHVAINRYGDVFGHLDKKSLARRALQAVAAKTPESVPATSTAQMAPTRLTQGRPVATVMGEVGWTWVSEVQARNLLQYKGYGNISSLRRDAQGIWRAKAMKDDLVLHVAVDLYGNVEIQPQNLGGLAQASGSD